MSIEKFVVIGAQAAGMTAASQAKRRSPQTIVTVFDAGQDVSVYSCGLPYYLGGVVGDLRELVVGTREAFIEKRKIDLRTGHEVLAIDAGNQRIRVRDRASDREHDEAYDRLCISTGAKANSPTAYFKDLSGVFNLRTMEGARKIHSFIENEKPRTAVIIGGGYIGLEVAENLSIRGISVSVIERMSSAMCQIGPEIGRMINRTLEVNGVKLYAESEAEALDGAGRVRCVHTGKHDLDADLVIVSMGITPNSALGLDAGLTPGAQGALYVNKDQTTSEKNIYAAGDCCDNMNLVTGKRDYVALGTIANKEGRVAGQNAVGGTEVFQGVVGTRIARVFGLEVGRTGLTLAEAREHGFDARAKSIKSYSRAKYFPGGGDIFIKIVYDAPSGRILGGQAAGIEGVKGRIDVFVAACTRRMTISEFSDLDLAYSPPFSPVWDPILVASNVAKRGR